MLKSMDRKSRTNSSNMKDFTVRPFSDVAESNKKGVDVSKHMELCLICLVSN